MNICVFQGTFNPIHNAHLRIAKYVAEKYCFDKLIFIPAYAPPHKNYDKNISLHRLNMVKLATEGNISFEVSDIEYRRKGVSYTYLTICELSEQYGIKDKINFIIGTDAFEKIESWYEAERLKEIVRFIVFKRENNFEDTKFEYLKQKGYDFSVESLKFDDISSSMIRQKLRENEDISKYIDKKVEEYIKRNGIYRN